MQQQGVGAVAAGEAAGPVHALPKQQGRGNKRRAASPKPVDADAAAAAKKPRNTCPAWDAARVEALVSARELGFSVQPGIPLGQGSWKLGMGTAGVQDLLAGFSFSAQLGQKWTALVSTQRAAAATQPGLPGSISAYRGAGPVQLTAGLLERIRVQAGVEQSK